MRDKIQKNRKERRELENKQTEDIIKVYANDNSYTKKQMRVIYTQAYNASHSYGIYEVLQELEELIIMVDEVKE